MAQAEPLPSEEKVRLLTASADLTPVDADRYGDLFAAAGKFPQAMMFYERSRSRDRLERIKAEAVRSGDAFLLHGITRLAPDIVSETDWSRAGEAALHNGMLIFARDCFEKANDAEKAQAARDEWLKIFAPPGPAPA